MNQSVIIVNGYPKNSAIILGGSNHQTVVESKSQTLTIFDLAHRGQEGAPGVRGEDGYSAYELALQTGFVGTETEWINSLVGAPGDIGSQGLPGPMGVTGPIGLTGSGGDLNYTHTQSVPSATWIVTHNLNKYPNVVVVDSAGTVVVGEVIYDSLLEVTLVFTAGFSGKAYLN